MIGGEPRGRPLGLHTSGQTRKGKASKVPIWQHFLAFLAPRVWPREKSLGASKTETQTLVERSNFFSIKYSKSDKRTLIIYFNELLFHLWRGVWGLASRFNRSSVKRPLYLLALLTRME